MNLTDLVQSLPDWLFHRIRQWMGIAEETLHDWIPGLCRCGKEHGE